jgi:hypothetical protein
VLQAWGWGDQIFRQWGLISHMGFQNLSLVAPLPARFRRAKFVSIQGSQVQSPTWASSAQFSGTTAGSPWKNQAWKQWGFPAQFCGVDSRETEPVGLHLLLLWSSRSQVSCLHSSTGFPRVSG